MNHYFRYFRGPARAFSLLVMIALLSGCMGKSVGLIPSGTPNTGSGTPSVPHHVKGSSRAYVSQNQLMVGPDGAEPVRVTNFDFADKPNVFWSQPAWSLDAHYIAFVMTAWPGTIRDGGCPPPDYSANGGLYLYDLGKNQTRKLTLPQEDTSSSQTRPYDGAWQYVFWEDPNHLLAWYNGVAGKTRNLPGLYRYDLKRQQFSLVVSQKSLGVATRYVGTDNNAFKPGKEPLMLSMRYSSGQIFYEVLTETTGQPASLVMYQRSVTQPDKASNKVADVGQMRWCSKGSLFSTPGWDVAADGRQIVAQKPSPDGSSTIQALSVAGGATTKLFAKVPAALLARDAFLAWAPDNRHIALSSTVSGSSSGPYTTSLDDAGKTQEYTPTRGGLPQWSPATRTFVIGSPDVFSKDKPAVYLYRLGEKQGKELLTNAYYYVWG